MTNKKMIIINVITIFVCFLVGGLISWKSFYSISQNVKNFFKAYDIEIANLITNRVVEDLNNKLVTPTVIAENMANDNSFIDVIKKHDGDLIIKYLAYLQNHFECSTTFFADDSDYMYYTYSGKLSNVKKGRSTTEWYWKLRNSSQVLKTEIASNRQKNSILTVYVDYKVFDLNNKILGICGVGFELKDMMSIFEKYNSKHGVDVYLVKDGKLQLGTKNDENDFNYQNGLTNSNKSGECIFRYDENGGYSISKYVPSIDSQIIITRTGKADGVYSVVESSRVVIYQYIIAIIVSILIMNTIAFLIFFYRERKDLFLKTKIDRMTGLFNKTGFRDESEKILNLDHDSIAFIFLDLDNFKSVNDKLGHAIGDKAIIDAANSISSILRKEDLKGRFGGDEFCVCIKDISEDSLRMKLENLVSKLSKTYCENSLEVSVTGSVGCIYYETNHQLDFDKLMKEADELLYDVKKNGKNSYLLKKNNL